MAQRLKAVKEELEMEADPPSLRARAEAEAAGNGPALPVKFRHLKTIVQHVGVLDDGEELVEKPLTAVVLSPAECRTYFTERFPADWARLVEAVATAPSAAASDE